MNEVLKILHAFNIKQQWLASEQDINSSDYMLSNEQRSFTILPDTDLFSNMNNNAIAIWLDDTVGLSLENRRICAIEQLRQIISHIEIFKDIYECNNYVRSIGIERIFLIVTGTFGDSFDMDLFEEYADNLKVYILTKTTMEAPKTHGNIRGCFNDIVTLLDKIKDDYLTFDTNSTSSNVVESTTRFVNPELVQWKCLQLTMDLFRRMPYSYEETKRNFVKLCRSQYGSNHYELKNIDQFEIDYEKNKAVDWYSRDTFIYGFLNSNMRMNNIDAIMTFTFFINDLCDQMNELRAYKNRTTSDLFTVYRGCYMHLKELQNLQNNIGRFISNNSLLSTSKNLNVAEFFSEAVCVPMSVLMEISVQYSCSISKSFASIGHYSGFPDENEVLFTNGHIFRIDSCERSSENRWLLKLTLCDDSHPIVEMSSDYFDIAVLQLIEILPKISPRTNKANDQMLELWRFYCKNDPSELEKIEQFEETYRSDAAVRWYTKDSILFRLLNAALRQENIDMIIDFRYFIIDLYDQLTTYHINYLRNFTKSKLTVYRGQKISLSELKRLKCGIGKHISMKSFFSASQSSSVASIFAELSESDKQQNLQSVLFQIDIDMEKLAKSMRNRIFSQIMNVSCFIDEKEVLFMANTQFRLKSVIPWNEELWVIELTLLSEDDENNRDLKIMNQYLDYFTRMLNEDKNENVSSFFKEQLLKKKSKPFHFVR